MKYAKPAAELSGDLDEMRLIRPGELATIRRCAVSTVYRDVREGRLPPPRRISHRCSGWTKGELIPYLSGERTAA